MPRLDAQIDIPAARVEVFKFCYDFSRWADWNTQIAGVELLSPAPIRRGTLLRIDSKPGAGPVFSWEAEVVEYQMPSGSTIRAIDTAKSSPFAAGSEFTWKFEPASGGNTRLTWIWDYQHRGFLASVMDALGRRRAYQKAMEQSLVNLKEMIETRR